MTLQEAVRARHSVRSYLNRPIAPEVRERLLAAIDEINRASGLHLQLICDEPKAFQNPFSGYGLFAGVRNYIALIGPKGPDLEEKCGYYGEHLVLLAQQLGLNTCWVGGTYRKILSVFAIAPGETVTAVIALGYGAHPGRSRKSKRLYDVVRTDRELPDWFRSGAEAALLAPTALNQQKFTLTLSGDKVIAKAGRGFYTKMDLGIVKYHFEIGAGDHKVVWGEP